jgi:mono/diheme cytochrome c family protein
LLGSGGGGQGHRLIVKPRFLLWVFLGGAALASPPPAELYLHHCQGCHLADGSGVPGAVPPLSDLGKIVASPGGRVYMLQVPGVATSSLSDAETAQVLNYILDTFTAIQAVPFKAEEVQRYRKTPLINPGEERKRILEGR